MIASRDEESLMYFIDKKLDGYPSWSQKSFTMSYKGKSEGAARISSMAAACQRMPPFDIHSVKYL